MSKVDLEKAIMDAAKSVPATYGEYRLVTELRFKIARIMGYKVVTFIRGGRAMTEVDEYDKVSKIMRAMADKGYIKFSKSGQAYKILF